VWSGKEAASEVSFRLSGLVISRSVSYGEYRSVMSWKWTAVRAIAMSARISCVRLGLFYLAANAMCPRECI
jgi:hypothetical protein